MPPRVGWRSSAVVTHGDVSLSLLLRLSVSYLPIDSLCPPRYRSSWAATVGRLASIPSPTCESSSVGAATTASTPWPQRGRCRAVRALAARRPPVPALDGVAAPVGRGRVLPGLCHRRHPETLVRRLRPSALGAGRVADPQTGAPAVQGPDHRRPAVGRPERLRPGRALGPARLADLRSLRVEHRRPGRGTRPRVLRVRGKGGSSSSSRCHRGRQGHRRAHQRADPAQHPQLADGRTPPAAGSGTSPLPQASGCQGCTPTCCATPS